MFGSYLTSAIRTGVPAAVGWLVSWLIARGVSIPADARAWAVGGLTFGALLAYYLTVRALEEKWPQLGVLLGVPSRPSYSKSSAPPAATPVPAPPTA